jgi:hypothetical protein
MSRLRDFGQPQNGSIDQTTFQAQLLQPRIQRPPLALEHLLMAQAVPQQPGSRFRFCIHLSSPLLKVHPSF